MPKKDPVVPSSPKMEPRAHISWDTKDLKPSGLEHATMGKAVTVTLSGKIAGYSMNDYGCALDVEPSGMVIAKSARNSDEGPSMVETVKGMKAKYGKNKE